MNEGFIGAVNGGVKGGEYRELHGSTVRTQEGVVLIMLYRQTACRDSCGIDYREPHA